MERENFQERERNPIPFLDAGRETSFRKEEE
jgi:hypothetical protein